MGSNGYNLVNTPILIMLPQIQTFSLDSCAISLRSVSSSDYTDPLSLLAAYIPLR